MVKDRDKNKGQKDVTKRQKPSKKDKKCNCSIGGQAVLEGVMMLGERSRATAVRDEKGNIQVESSRFTPIKQKSIWRRIPFIRGVLNFVSTMFVGVSVLMRASEVFEGETEPSKFEKKFADKFHMDIMSVIMSISVIIGLALSIALFFVIPHFIIVGIEALIADVFHAPPIAEIWLNLIEGAFRILIFAGYIALTALMKDINRVYMYHGAEHKTISCYERGLPLTVENVQKQSTIHDRCGTTFMFLVMIVSVVLFTFTGFIPTDNIGIKLLVKLALLPVVAGISYEILKFLARFDNLFVKIIKAPGLLLQKLTTKQPTDEMVEVAITAFQTVYEMDRDLEIPIKKFRTKLLYAKFRVELDKILENIGDGNADADWLCVEVLKVKRSELLTLTHIWSDDAEKIKALAQQRADGQPLQQILGYTDFYGMNIKVTGDVLCPRTETEYLVEECTKLIKSNNLVKVLDMCTGSGAIALIVKRDNQSAVVTASDVSEKALEIARENAENNGIDIEFILSDMFENITEKYDLLISNPPYINTQALESLDKVVKDYEPNIALDGGEDGLNFYRIIVDNLPNAVNDGGYVALEIGYDQAVSVTELLCGCEVVSSDSVQIIKDMEGFDRIIIAKIVKSAK